MSTHHRHAVVRLAEQLRQLHRPADILDALDQTVQPMGLRALDTFWLPPNYGGAKYEIDKAWFGCCCTLSDKFWREFEGLVKEHGVSVLTRYAIACKTPFTFRQASRALNPYGRQRWVFELFADYKIRDGYFFPAHNGWMLTLWAPKVLKLSEAEDQNLSYAAHVITHRVHKLVPKKHPPALSARQYSVLERFGHGYNSEEIAEALHMTKGTVDEHLKRARLKLGARNSTHAAVMLHYLPAPMCK